MNLDTNFTEYLKQLEEEIRVKLNEEK